jgi:TRAP-type uncharacterized transport system fused permease subunit
LGIALALTFLMFPFGSRRSEEAVASKALGEKQEARAGLDIVLALLRSFRVSYVAARYPELIKTHHPSMVRRAGRLVIVLLVFEATAASPAWRWSLSCSPCVRMRCSAGCCRDPLQAGRCRSAG